jgi:hypothetical protein
VAEDRSSGVWIENPTAAQLEKEQLFLSAHAVNSRPVSASAVRMFHPSASQKEQELLAKLMTCQADLVMSRNDNAIVSKQLARSGALCSEPYGRWRAGLREQEQVATARVRQSSAQTGSCERCRGEQRLLPFSVFHVLSRACESRWDGLANTMVPNGVDNLGCTDDRHEAELKATRDEARRKRAEEAAELLTRLLAEEVDRRISACNTSKREGKAEGHREGYREGQDSGRAEMQAAVAEATAVAEARVAEAMAAAAALDAELVVQRGRLEAALSGRGNFVEQGTQSEWCV